MLGTEIVRVHQEEILKIAEKRYTGDTIRVLLFLLALVEVDNRIKSYTQIDISYTIGVSQSRVSNAYKELLRDGIIIRVGRDYYMSDDLVDIITMHNSEWVI